MKPSRYHALSGTTLRSGRVPDSKQKEVKKMTYIEFFDKDHIENICSSILKTPEKVILFGDSAKHMRAHAKRYSDIMKDRGADVEFVCRSVRRNSVSDMTRELSSIVGSGGDFVIDLTGGEDLFLVAAGMTAERYRDRPVQLQRFNIRSSIETDVDEDSNMFMPTDEAKISVEENIRIYGGDVVFAEERAGATYRWDMSPGFRQDIRSMWDICRKDPGLWNIHANVFDTADRYISPEEGRLAVCVPEEQLKNEVRRQGRKYVFSYEQVIGGLVSAGVLRSFSCKDGLITYEYRDGQVRRCLTSAGRTLEMKIYLTALEARESSGEPTYSDAMTGVFIDWDGRTGPDSGRYGTENEIDVMMMHGMVPVFVSCKNGVVDIDELYKLNTVAGRFGGKYAKKVLVASSLDENDNSGHLRQRAKDMGIRIFDGFSRYGVVKSFTEMDDEELSAAVRTFWSD